jgi:hypothetical protein
LETNLNIGPHATITYLGFWGYQANVDVKFRYKYLAVGINLGYATGYSPYREDFIHVVS